MKSARQVRRDARMYLSRQLGRSLAPPDRVSVNLTLRCNLACTMCTTCYEAPELVTDEVKAIIDQTAAWGVEVFNPLGGEPFMRADIEEILAYAVRRGFYVTVTTNATLITEKRARAIAAIPPDRLHLNISLDGDAQANDLVRGAGMWRRAITGYQRVRAADLAAGNSRRKILANTILHARNLGRFEAILAEQAALGFDGVQILNLFRAGEGAPAKARDLWFSSGQLGELAALTGRLAEQAAAQRSTGYQIQNDPMDLRKIPSYYTEALTPLEAPCWAGWKELYINADGAAIMCDGKLDFLAGAFGNIREQTLQELWRSPALAARRAVVKQCRTPCIQDCYLRRESDSGARLLAQAGSLVAAELRAKAAALSFRAEEPPESLLTLELSDTCPCDWEGCTTPAARWRTLVADCPEPATPARWAELRDRGYLDFGRGFMGFELVRAVAADLRAARLRFGTLSLSWRGEPLLHPEIAPILRSLLDTLAAGGLARRLRIETSGAFLTAELAALAGRPGVPQEWVVDLDRGDGAGVATLLASRGPHTRLVLAVHAVEGLDAAALARRWPGFTPVVGRFPEGEGDALWFRRRDHDHFLANQRARAALEAAATTFGLSAESGSEDRPRRCRAPARSPTVSWDGKIVLCGWDRQLQQVVGEVTSGRLSEVWRGPELVADRAACAGGRGVPERELCRDCPMPWSPNHP